MSRVIWTEQQAAGSKPGSKVAGVAVCMRKHSFGGGYYFAWQAAVGADLASILGFISDETDIRGWELKRGRLRRL